MTPSSPGIRFPRPAPPPSTPPVTSPTLSSRRTNRSLEERSRPERPTGKIDRIVYELYGLAAEEIAVVEGAG